MPEMDPAARGEEGAPHVDPIWDVVDPRALDEPRRVDVEAEAAAPLDERPLAALHGRHAIVDRKRRLPEEPIADAVIPRRFRGRQPVRQAKPRPRGWAGGG